MTSVWIVESGEYSDYSVDAIFSTEAQAKEFSEQSGGTYREWPLDTWTPEQVRVTVIFDRAGNVVSVRDEVYTEPLPNGEGINCSSAYSGNIDITVRRGPKERAVKVASEKFLQLMAKMDEAKQRCADLPENLKEYWQGYIEIKCASVLAGLEGIPAGENSINSFLRRACGGAA